ncbi:MAG: hypothetical protein A2493_02010 [Candidatus Magasanikbacteria bacterium RIFOXYC12_FULL_33_11]|uniref:Protein CR006 P-loop domain-containing protein n=1 Tax=Candidatus Magasanikbacteria bacterium RIFOXYC12_FULL_33_11 TaxID=1798701 RepID=A0A1F6NNP6_9BACT|nr:MAG: hypothetical protein A2493_02010 [Candidatus Magasanikbacteria bacterium RIFOXYC12_FULL_33_11]
MNKLKIELQNCYGIKKLNHEFDFSNCKTFVIYAPNGVMKTSFAKTLKNIAKDEKPCDQIDDTLTAVYNFFIDEDNNQIEPEEICVIEPYNKKTLDSEDKILTLLADEQTKKEYLEIFNEIESLKKSTLAGLKKISGSSNYESEIIEAFSNIEKKNIFEIFDTILNDIEISKDSFEFKYNDVFDKGGKVKKFLAENFELLKQYIEKYNDLISKSGFFAKGVDHIFGTTEAKILGKSLEGDEYFTAGHKLVLKSHGDVSAKNKLSEIINEEIAKVFGDKDLKDIFEKIDNLLDANKELQAFKKVIEKDNSILLRLSDYDVFRREVWFSFLKQIEVGLKSLVELYNQKKVDLENIIQKAKDGQSHWESAIKEFENRFVNNPFTLEIQNKADAVLNEKTPAIDFKFQGKDIERSNLIENILSQGEKRAFYILNVIFEIKSRQLQNKKTLFIIDDIADSFDYKNKYAIVEYLNDLSKEDNFCSIILTHNFDFFRTLQSRILQNNKWEYSFIAEKLKDEIKLIKAGNRNVTDPFTNWKAGVNSNEKHLIACIPFVRNLIEFKEGQNDNYKTLTHILHKKLQDGNIKATVDITINDLQVPFSSVLSSVAFTFADTSKKIIDVIEEQIADIKGSENSDSIVLEDKIILAIGIRLKAEEYMWSKITNQDLINGSQTGRLFQRYKDEFKQDQAHDEYIKILESVNIMTPENIHLNSFMYEPILDMGIDELKSLHDKACNLTSN